MTTDNRIKVNVGITNEELDQIALDKLGRQLTNDELLEIEEKLQENKSDLIRILAIMIEEIDAPYDLSDNQRQFVQDALAAGHEIDWSYSGRGMYGRECPAIRVDDLEFMSRAEVEWDNMGLGYVIYAKN